MDVTDPERIHHLLDRYILTEVETPAQYLGGERNAVRKDHRHVEVAFALLFPDAYKLGMSHLGYQILYAVINDLPWACAERAYTPWPDMQQQMRAHGIPLYALESFTPVRKFDVVGFSLQYELLLTNVLKMLELAGIPLESRDRTQADPIVIAGGPGAAAPEPMADFVDLFFVGDAEESIVEFAELVRRLKAEGARREAMILEAARRIPSLYASAYYRPEYDSDEKLLRICPTADGLPERIRAAKLKKLEGAPFPRAPIVPLVETVHERVTLEIMRGCTRGCRFCQAGMQNRPVRCRPVDELLEIAECSYRNTGHSQVALMSLSSSDYPHISHLLSSGVSLFSQRFVDLSLPSLRVSDQLALLPKHLSSVRKSGLTIAPEAATERLRAVINKDISEADLLAGVTEAYRQGWRLVKLYFMIGLPTETDEDVEALVALCERVSAARRAISGSAGQVNVSIAPFVPKAHTPFQWEPMAPLERVKHLEALIRKKARSNRIRFKFHNPEQSFLEAVIARGDRRLGKVIKRVWQRGGQFDGWSQHFSFRRWMEAFEAEGLAPEFYATRSRPTDEALPWDHIDCGVEKEFLIAERQKAFRGEMTPDCRTAGCQRCGACSRAHQPHPESGTP